MPAPVERPPRAGRADAGPVAPVAPTGGAASQTGDAAAPVVWTAAERAARDGYGRLVARLAYRWRDLAAAEDALSQAFAAALERWPREGVPDAPEAWLMAVAKRELLQRARHARLQNDPGVQALLESEPAAAEAPALPDQRLALLFVCAHPALPAALHAPLMLQAVLGLDAQTIADAFLVSPAAMAQRLVRAKGKIRQAGLRFELPETRELPARLGAVLESIYGAYTIGRQAVAGGSAAIGVAGALPAAVARGGLDRASAPPSADSLTGEALYLGRLVVALQPDSAEALGLLALMLYCEARQPAQFDAAGRFVPLAEQPCGRWLHEPIREAEGCLWRASRLRSPGAFQIEAAIQSAHCQRAHTGQTPWPAIVQLYDTLVRHFPSTGACIGRAVALAEIGDIAAGVAALDALPPEQTRNHQPYWVSRAHLDALAGRPAAAADALRRAIGLTEDRRLRDHLIGRLAALGPVGIG